MNSSAPHHGGQLRNLATHFDIPATNLLDFSANINPDGPPPAVLPALKHALEDPATLSLYPDLDERELKQSIANYVAVEPAQIAVANGFVPLLEAALRILPIRRCLLPVPAFTEYRNALARARISVMPYPLPASESFRYDPHALLAADQDAILLANPQNPSGICTPYDEMVGLVSEAAARNIFVLLDEAFIDYIPEHSLVRNTTGSSNLIVFRSVTKFHAMPGLRIAYAVGSPALIAALTTHLPPWPITTLASCAARTALVDHDYAAQTRERNTHRRELLIAGLKALNLDPHPSSANFVLFRLPNNIDATTLWQRLILEHRIVLRDCSNFQSLPPGYLRAAVRNEADNERLLQALEQTLA
jgi:threonine-phosphate decarboxylase